MLFVIFVGHLPFLIVLVLNGYIICVIKVNIGWIHWCEIKVLNHNFLRISLSNSLKELGNYEIFQHFVMLSVGISPTDMTPPTVGRYCSTFAIHTCLYDLRCPYDWTN